MDDVSFENYETLFWRKVVQGVKLASADIRNDIYNVNN